MATLITWRRGLTALLILLALAAVLFVNVPEGKARGAGLRGMLVDLAGDASGDYFDVNKFSFLSDPVPLRYGEVHNKLQPPIPLPEDLVKRFEGGKMGIVNYAIDIVFEDGSQAPLSQGYNHHYGLIMGSADVMDDLYEKYGKEVLGSSMGGGAHLFRSLRATVEEHNKHNKDKRVASFGGGSGAEERHTAHGVAAPYAHVIDTPEKFMPLIHLINTKGAKTEAGYSPLLECPCTPQREIDVARGLIDGKPPMPPFACNAQFLEAKNPSCSIALYEGGYRCCEHGNFLRDLNKQPVRDDEQVTTFRFKFTVEVREVSEDVVPLRPAGCCDVTGNTTHFGNIEYDVPKCATGTPPAQCIHEATSVQPIDMALGGFGSMTRETIDPNALIDLVQITGHLHVGGISFDLYNDATGELLCHSVPTYGETHAAGDEKGYVVGMSSCHFGGPGEPKPIRMRRGQMVRSVARYNATQHHHGVMALALIDLADVDTMVA